MQPCENAELYCCRVCLKTFCLCVSVGPADGAFWPVFCDLGHDPSQLVPADVSVADCVRVLRVGLRPGLGRWTVIGPLETGRADA